MKIIVDGQCFQTASNVRGIGRYVTGLLSSLVSYDDIDLVVSLNGSMKEEAIAARAFLRRYIPKSEIAIWYGLAPNGEAFTGCNSERKSDERILASHINSLSPDVAISPSPFEGAADRASPLLDTSSLNCATACVFHDAIPHRYADIYLKDPNTKKMYYRRLNSVSSFDLVLCNSQYTLSEYKDIFRARNGMAIGAGLDENFKQAVEAGPSQIEAAALSPYILYVGGMDWRKNLSLLIDGIAATSDGAAGKLKLVLVGETGEAFLAPLRALWRARGLNPKNFIALGWLPDADLARLYRKAAATVQPSLMEGFGLTALEAMAAGSPYFAARGGAVAEVLGDDALTFDAASSEQLAQLIARVTHDAEFRAYAIAHGRKRLSHFTWERAAARALDGLRGVAHARRPWTPPPAIAEVCDQPRGRLIVDVSSTAQSPVMSGIQRVMHNLTQSLKSLNSLPGVEIVLSYCRDERGWHRMRNLDKGAISLDPRDRLAIEDSDTYLLLDSSWDFTEGQRGRLIDALVIGQEVVHGLHDLGPLTMPAMTDVGMPPAFRRWIEFVLGHSTAIVCVSRAVADELYRLVCAIELPRPMKIGYLKLGADFAPVEPDASWLDFLGGRPTFLMVGTLEPRKGHAMALAAFDQIWSEGADVNLLIVGNPGWDTQLLRAQIESHREFGRRLFLRSGVADAQLKGAYDAADALVMASYLEGFGLPVVEAARAGCALILGDLPVFREIAGEAAQAYFFSPGSARSLAASLRKMLKTWKRSDRRRASEWPSWSRSAQDLKSLLFEGGWYRSYAPTEVRPNVKCGEIGHVMLTRPLAAEERRHSVRYVEGPSLSDDGRDIKITVAIKNESDTLWSSYVREGGGLEVNIGSHIYSEGGACLEYENPRTAIPFVLIPHEEVYCAIRVKSDWLIRGAAYVGVELVQEGVTWFGESLRAPLLRPERENVAGPGKESVGELVPKWFRTISKGVNKSELYFVFAIFNPSKHDVDLRGAIEDSAFEFVICNDEGRPAPGCWIVNAADCAPAQSYALVCAFADADALMRTQRLDLVLRGDDERRWSFKISPQDLSLSIAEPVAPAIEPRPPAPLPIGVVSDVIVAGRRLRRTTLDSWQPGNGLVMRRFHRGEGTHIWLNGLEGELELANILTHAGPVARIEITCAAIEGLAQPATMSLALGGAVLGKVTISTRFMTYAFEAPPSLRDGSLGPQSRLRIVAEDCRVEPGGERELSICVVRVALDQQIVRSSGRTMPPAPPAFLPPSIARSTAN